MKCPKCGYESETIYVGGCWMCGAFWPEECLKRAYVAMEKLAEKHGTTVDGLLNSVGMTSSEIGYGSRHSFFMPNTETKAQ